MNPEFLYIHIPFCIKKCVYCDFLSVRYDEAIARKYVHGLCKELTLKKNFSGTLKTVYIGGGTPTVLPKESFKELFKCIKDNFKYYPIEITVEANPGTLNGSKTDALLYLGVNRVSIGTQSFNNNELKTLGRIHTPEDAVKSVEMIKNAGLRNFSVDLMYGIPGQTIETWLESLEIAVGLSPAHISSYELTPEKNTPLYGLIESGKIKIPEEELVLDMYNHAIDYFERSGYEQYEISNFALPGHQCIHNLNYWDPGEYIGAGAGAHSFINGCRSRNTDNIDAYIEKVNMGIIPEMESMRLTHTDKIKELIFLGLRKREGISLLKASGLGIDIPGSCKEMTDKGYLEIKDNYLRLTRKGIVVSNEIIVRIFEGLRLD